MNYTATAVCTLAPFQILIPSCPLAQSCSVFIPLPYLLISFLSAFPTLKFWLTFLLQAKVRDRKDGEKGEKRENKSGLLQQCSPRNQKCGFGSREQGWPQSHSATCTKKPRDAEHWVRSQRGDQRCKREASSKKMALSLSAPLLENKPSRYNQFFNQNEMRFLLFTKIP